MCGARDSLPNAFTQSIVNYSLVTHRNTLATFYLCISSTPNVVILALVIYLFIYLDNAQTSVQSMACM